jgi:hypothetical protein
VGGDCISVAVRADGGVFNCVDDCGSATAIVALVVDADAVVVNGDDGTTGDDAIVGVVESHSIYSDGRGRLVGRDCISVLILFIIYEKFRCGNVCLGGKRLKG